MNNLEKISKIIDLNILDELKRRKLKVELIGTWIWVSGRTSDSKTYLKANGFKWSKNKFAWSYHNGPKYHKKSDKTYTLDELRKAFS